jgi:BTB/POZ domain
MNIDWWTKLYDETDEANVSLVVEGKVFHAHRVALKIQAPGLYELVEEFTGEGPISIEKTNFDGNVLSIETFDVIHRFIYTVLDLEDNNNQLWDTLEKTQNICCAADLFGCTTLKLYAESVLVEKYLKAETCGALLVLADSHSCALLKEAAQHLYKNDASSVSQSDGWKSLVTDSQKLLAELLHCCTVASSSENHEDIDSWSVTTLREKLQEAKLDLDGSKEMLIKRMKDHVGGQPSQDG